MLIPCFSCAFLYDRMLMRELGGFPVPQERICPGEAVLGAQETSQHLTCAQGRSPQSKTPVKCCGIRMRAKALSDLSFPCLTLGTRALFRGFTARHVGRDHLWGYGYRLLSPCHLRWEEPASPTKWEARGRFFSDSVLPWGALHGSASEERDTLLGSWHASPAAVSRLIISVGEGHLDTGKGISSYQLLPGSLQAFSPSKVMWIISEGRLCCDSLPVHGLPA